MTSACLASAAFISKPQKFRLLRISSTPDSANSSGTCLPPPAVILPGLGNNTGDYEKLQMTLMEKGGVPSVVAKVSRLDWFRNAAGLVDANYWKGTLSPRPVLDWYLKRVDDAVREAKELAEGGTFSVIGHSAGGWLARVYMEEFGRDGISLLLTLTCRPPPKGLPGVIDQTRGLLYYVKEKCAKPEYTPEVKYVCIAGRYIQGSPIFGPSDVASDYTTTSLNTIQPDSEAATLNDITKSAPPTLRARFVGQGYKQVCGRSDVWGDGVVPEVSAHLDGALNISLDGVYHSPVGSDDELRPWYGSPVIVDQWIHHLLVKKNIILLSSSDQIYCGLRERRPGCHVCCHNSNPHRTCSHCLTSPTTIQLPQTFVSLSESKCREPVRPHCVLSTSSAFL